MSGDYSRVVYDPARDYDGVLLQQGRPLLDADWNDLVAQINRLAQATRDDTFGGAAVVPVTTPDGFKLALSGAQFTIGRGRIYVDGLLAENHGLPSPTWNSGVAWDAALAELYGTNPVPYDQQTYLPNPPPLPTAGGPYLVYVDVWQREVTLFEAPDLVDPALGVDTTARLQTVWQIRALANSQGTSIDCDTDPASIPGWSALTAPSAGRLSTGTASFGTDNPCLIPPTGGYTGLENQLYRIEIHDGGAPGTATFKWSRDNASVETRVSSFVDTSTLVVESVGKDGALRFNDGDWIEVLDDWLELNNQPGELHRIVLGGGVDDATRTITLEKPVTAGRFNADPAAKRNTRIRRWDQKGQVLRTDGSSPAVYLDLDAAASTGAIPVPADGTVMLALESGIVVSFDVFAAGGLFKSGDWWVFAARTADASVEPLAHAAPRGIHHHYAKLGLYTPGSQPVDCRQFWPPSFGGDSCACTVCVSPQAHAQSAPSVQQAIDSVVAQGGGTVCLEIGDYELRAPLRIDGARTLTVRGQGQATRLLAPATSIAISKASDITLERFAIESASESTQASFSAITVNSTESLRVQQIAMVLRSGNSTSAAIALSGQLAELRLCDNLIRAPLGIISAAGGGDSKRGPITMRSLQVVGNLFDCATAAIDLQLNADSRAPLQVLRNRISGCSKVGIELRGTGIADGGIEVAGNRLDVSGSGIAVGVPGSRILDNDLSNAGGSSTATLDVGIAMTPVPGGATALGDCHILGNRIAGFSRGGILVATALGKLQIKQNQIERCGAGIDVADGQGAEQLAIENNQISDIDANARDTSLTRLVGIGVVGAAAVSIAGNAIVRIGLGATSPNLTTSAVLVEGIDGIRIIGNELSDIGPAEAFSGAAFGILARSAIGDVIIDDNRIRRDSEVRAADASTWFGVVIFGSTQALPVGRAKAKSREKAELMPESLRRFALAPKQKAKAVVRADAVARSAGSISVRGNQITARGGTFAVAISAVPICDFSNNQCVRSAAAGVATNVTQPDVFLAAQTLVVGGNRVAGPKGPSMSLQAPEGRYTVLGNITAGSILAQQAPLTDPWAALNVQGA